MRKFLFVLLVVFFLIALLGAPVTQAYGQGAPPPDQSPSADGQSNDGPSSDGQSNGQSGDQNDQNNAQTADNQAPPGSDQPAPAHLSADQLQQLVAPIALYPDSLVAQILAAAAYPTEVVEADRFIKENPDLKGKALADQVDKEDWDPSVKALTAFPSVLANMDKNLSWTSELGDANVNQASEVMDAVQFLRKKAHDTGHLDNTPQQKVTEENDDWEIAPADPDVVYVPVYDPAFVYGYPFVPWPGLYYPWWGVGPVFSFGIGYPIGPFFGFGWGWGHWGFDWYHHGILFGGGRYAFHSRAFYDRNAYFHGNSRGFHEPFARGDRGFRGYGGSQHGPEGHEGHGFGGRPAEPGRSPGLSGGHTGAFGDVNHGGTARGFSSRGQSSFGGGGFHGGGGGGRGGGGRR
jgi:uncharacterized membrane protein YgcG